MRVKIPYYMKNALLNTHNYGMVQTVMEGEFYIQYQCQIANIPKFLFTSNEQNL